MIKDLLRIIGSSCMITAGALYFMSSTLPNANEQTKGLAQEIHDLKQQLAHTKEQLAIAQTVKHPQDEAEEKHPIEIKLTIAQGDNTTVVSEKLEKAKILQNAEEFEDYLKAKRLAGNIQIGEYTINDSMDYETIAKTITNQP